MPLLATIRGDSVTGISIAAEPSLRIDPSTKLVMTSSGLLSVFRAFDANWTNTARVYTRRVPGTGAVDVSVGLFAPGEAQRGSVIRVPLRVANVGTQPATGIESHVDVYGGRVVSYPNGCSTGPFAISVLCPEPELQPGSAAYLYFEVEVLHPNLLLKAAAYAHEQDPATQNNVATAIVNVTPVTRTRAVRR
jgi:hypothetical protein